jgi:phosphatidyl-myo-inositol alpha-mannosyltransferase
VRPLRIGICAPYDLGRPGGVNSHIRAQARALRGRGHQVSIFGASSMPLTGDELALGGCVSFVIGGTETGFGVDPRSWVRVADMFRRSAFDILHLHEPLMPLVPWFVIQQSRAPIVATFHTHREDGHVWYPKWRWLLAPMMRRIHTRLAVSEAARETVARHFPGVYEVVPNGIDVERFQRVGRRPASMAADARNVLFVGRLEPRKGVDRLIRAVAIVQRHIGGVRLVIVGDGPDRAALESLARDERVDAVFAGQIADHDLPAYYRAADLVSSPALGGESFGIVLLEAMAAERPIVATRIDGYARLVDGAGCARLVPAGDVGALAREIAVLLEDAPLRHQLGRAGIAFARTYDWSAIAQHLESIYAGVSRAVH